MRFSEYLLYWFSRILARRGMAARRNRGPRMTRREKQREAQPKVKKIPVTALFLRVPTGIANGGVSEAPATSHSSLRAGKIFDERLACMGHPTPRSSPAFCAWSFPSDPRSHGDGFAHDDSIRIDGRLCSLRRTNGGEGRR